MQRREFIAKSGAVFTTAAFIGIFGNNSLLAATPGTEKKAKKRPDPNSFKQPIMKAIAVGLNAPSPHNTQSWKFKVLDDHAMMLYVDERILLPATDPPSRQIHLGAGCFIETLAVGITAFGYAAQVRLFPEGYHSDQDFGRKPVAQISLVKRAEAADPLAAFIDKRQTNRKAYHGSLVSEAEFQALQSAAGNGHSRVRFINSGMEPYFELFFKGFEIESRTFSTNEETRKLFRFSEKQRAEKGDGMSIPQMGFSGIAEYFAEKSLDNGDPQKWHSEKSIGQSLKAIKKGIKSAKGIVVWITDANTFEDWVLAGRDFVRFSLALTKENLWAHPYNQAIQEYAEMASVREQMDRLLGIAGSQKIQMMVRIGRGATSYRSYRRSLDAFLNQ